MENTPYLYDTQVQVLRQHRYWLDLRHLKTLAWMMVGLIHSGSMSLGAWTPFVISRAQYSQSIVRRFRRWLDNDKIEVHALYGPLMQQALVGWVNKTLYVALDTSMLWDTYCMVRLSVIYRGRADLGEINANAHGVSFSCLRFSLHIVCVNATRVPV